MSELRFSHLDIDCRNDSVRLGAQTGNISLPERICQISMTNEIDQANVIAVRTLDYKCWFFQNESCNVSEVVYMYIIYYVLVVVVGLIHMSILL